jgi:hypothetical protein
MEMFEWRERIQEAISSSSNNNHLRELKNLIQEIKQEIQKVENQLIGCTTVQSNRPTTNNHHNKEDVVRTTINCIVRLKYYYKVSRIIIIIL